MSYINSGIFEGLNHSGRLKASVAFIAALVLLQILFPVAVFAQGDLLITPRRVVFEGTKRSIDLNLANTGQDTSTYAISLIQMKMKEDGGFESITEPDPGQRFADQFVRFFPRSVTLGPNETQVVKIQLLRTGSLTEGEYRSHFYFRSVPESKPLGEEEAVRDTTNISVKLTPIFGITIPVIIRVGESTCKVTISDLKLETLNDTVPRLGMTLNRSGNMSVYGDLVVEHISSTGKITRIGLVSGVAVYTPNTLRRFQLNLNRIPGQTFLRVSYGLYTLPLQM